MNNSIATLKLVSTKEAATLVGLSPYFLYRNSKVFPGAHRAGKALRWDVAQLKTWMASQAVMPSREKSQCQHAEVTESCWTR